jgi:hypothetical protein
MACTKYGRPVKVGDKISFWKSGKKEMTVVEQSFEFGVKCLVGGKLWMIDNKEIEEKI